MSKRPLDSEESDAKRITLNHSKPQNSLVRFLAQVKASSKTNKPSLFELAGTKPQPRQEKQVYIKQSPPKPSYKLKKVLSGHRGWVNTIAVDPENQWFATGSNDNTIKIWDIASGKGKITLTGHTMAVQCLAISDRMPYMFSGGMDRSLKCWDLESNSVVREFHGHMSGINSIDLHPSLNLVASGVRDGSVHIWDIRSREQIFKLKGHKQTITSLKCRGIDPQIISASGDSTVRFWDLRTGHPVKAITSHKNAVGAIEIATNNTLVTASSDSIRKWLLPEGEEIEKVTSNSYVHSLSLSSTQVLAATRADGTVELSNFASSLKSYQSIKPPLMPGSLESESPILASAFDRSGSQLITGHSDKTVRIFIENA